MEKLEVVGKVCHKSEVELLGQNQIKKQIIAVETDGQYPQKIPVEFLKDKVDLLNNVEVGQSVKVSVNIKGKEYTDRNGVVRFGLSFQGWKIE
jgi:hypothetical protein